MTAAAIRDQAPDLKRWGIDYTTGSGCAGASVDITERGRTVATFHRLDVAERVVAALNAVEADR